MDTADLEFEWDEDKAASNKKQCPPCHEKGAPRL